MFRNRKQLLSLLKWLIMLAAYGYLIYKLANIEYWTELKHSFTTISLKRFLVFVGVLLLMPINWILEAQKWQVLTKNIVNISFKDAIKSVLAGLNTGFVTPSRFGDFAGRIIYLPSNLRLAGTLLSFVNGFIQTFVITVLGLIASYFYSVQFKSLFDYSKYMLSAIALLGVFVVIYILFPEIFKKLRIKSRDSKMQNTLKTLSELRLQTLVFSVLISTVRFLIFCFQYYLLLYFFKVELTPVQALIGIPTMYLIITYAPTLAASEAAVRASIAVLILGAFSNNEIGVLLTGLLIWLVNFIIPMIVGSVYMMKEKKHIH
ncbi:MAG: lysylphosphatidylglycerol synthase transmembrane domain-containing protein [Paludibacteraceae bacterium]